MMQNPFLNLQDVPRVAAMIPEQVKQYQSERLRQVVGYAAEHSPYYRDVLKGIDLKNFELRDLPIMTKKNMMEHFESIVTDSRLKKDPLKQWLARKDNLADMYLDRYVPLMTSGTTGEPSIMVMTRDEVRYFYTFSGMRSTWTVPSRLQNLFKIGRGLVKPWRMAAVVVTGSRVASSYITSLHLAELPGLAKRIYDRRFFHILDPLDKLVADLNAYQPDSMVSMSSTIHLLAREQLAGRLRLKFDPRWSSIIAGAEPLLAETRELALEAWGVNVHDSYGATECGVIGRSCRLFDRLHVQSDICLLEVVDKENNPVPEGEYGDKILVTNLFCTTQPIIRYEVNDVTGISLEKCGCGWPFPSLLPHQGRKTDYFYLHMSNGEFVHFRAEGFLSFMMHMKEVRQLQAVQVGRNEFVMNYLPSEAGFSQADVQARVDQEVAALNLPVAVKITCRPKTFLRDDRTGKMRVLVYDAPPPETLSAMPDPVIS